MVSGATGIDLCLLVVAADDGVMPQTVEHVRVLEGLGIRSGVVAVTKSDLADPAPTVEAMRELVPWASIVACSARTRSGVLQVADALDRAAMRISPRAAASDGARAVLHVDRVFTIKGAGTVVTGTLWSGALARGQYVRVLPEGLRARVRGVQVHDESVERAVAGQRVAVNLAGVERSAVSRGSALADDAAPVHVTYRVEASLALCEPIADRERVQVHHGTRAVPARAVSSGRPERWQLRLERPLIAADGDRLVIRRISPPGTIGGGQVITAAPRKRAERAAREGSLPAPHTTPPVPELDADALALEQRLRAAGLEPLSEHELGDDARHLRALHATGRAVRIGRSMHAHPDAIASGRQVLERIARERGSVTLAQLRDELHTSRKYAQALLEHFDAARVTRRLEDDRRVLRRS
jgi:selenocysteine-specific elongation factor